MRKLGVLASAAVALLASTSLAGAEPITLAIFGAAWVASNTFLAGVISFVFSAAFSFGVSLLQAALAPKEKPVGVNFELQVGDDHPVAFPAGTYATSGTRKYSGTWGNVGKTPNAYFVDVIQFSDLPCAGVTGMWMNGEKVTFGDTPHETFGYPILEYRKNGVDFMWALTADGSQTTTNAYLLDKFGTHPERPWQEDMIGRGCAYMVITARWNKDLHKSYPTALIEPAETTWYDLRKDTTAGGDGAHRWNDRSTYEGSSNPAVIIYNIIRGIYLGSEWIYGGQNIAAHRLPASNWMAAMNECDAPVDLDGGGTEPQFRCGAEITGDAEPLETIERLLRACNGRLAEVGGRFKILVGAPGSAVYSFTDETILVTREQGYRPYPRLEETYNGIEATYPEPIEMWQTRDAPARYSTELEIADGNRRLATGVQFATVPFGTQVQRLMQAMIDEERRFATHTIVLPPEAWVLEPLDVISWTSERNGYTDKKFIIVRIDGEPGLSQACVIKEIDPSDYDWSSEDEIPYTPTPVTPSRPEAQAIVDWDAEGYELVGDDGSKRPAIRLSWDGDDLDDIDFVLFEVRMEGDTALIHQGNTANVEGGEIFITQSLIRATEYEVRGVFQSNSGREFLWSDWLNVTTPSTAVINIPDDVLANVIEYSAFTDTHKAMLVSLKQTIAERFVLINDYLDELGNLVANQTGDSYSKLEYVKVKSENSFAAVTREITVLATADEALAESIDTVAAELDGEALIRASAIESMSVYVGRTSVSGTAQAGTSSLIVLASSASAVDDIYNGLEITIVSGTGIGQTRLITDYSGTSKAATISPNWDVVPNSTSVYSLGLVSAIRSNATLINALQAEIDGNIAQALETLETSVEWTQFGITGTAQNGGSSTTIKLASSASSVDDFYNDAPIRITAGPGLNDVRRITDYVGSTRIATVDSAFSATPTASSTYAIGIYAMLIVEASKITALSARLDSGDIAQAIDLTEAKVSRIETPVTGTAQSGSTSTTIKLAAGASSVDDFYNDSSITLTGGTGSTDRPVRRITDYVGSTRVATVDSAWPVTPDATTTYSIGLFGAVSAQATRLTSVSTTVDGHTSSISAALSSIDGIEAQYSVVGSIDGATGGFILSGIQQIDGSVTYDLVISADQVTIANLQNYIRNGSFDTGAVDVAAFNDIPRWWVDSGPTYVDVVTKATSGVPSGCPTNFCLRIDASGSPVIYTDIDPTESDAANRGIPVKSGQRWFMRFMGTRSGGTARPQFRVGVKTSGGSVTYQNTAAVSTTWTPGPGASWAEHTQEWAIANDGRMFVEITKFDGSGMIYLTEIELLLMNGATLIVDGSIIADHLSTNELITVSAQIKNAIITNAKIVDLDAAKITTGFLGAGRVSSKYITTELINDQAVVASVMVETVAGADDEVGNNTFLEVLTYTYTVTLPAGYAGSVVASAVLGVAYTGGANVDAYISIDGTTFQSYGGATIPIMSLVAQKAVTGTGSPQNFEVKIFWKGQNANATLAQRALKTELFKR